MPKKVLVVDDEPSITDLVSLILTEKGYEVSIANDGKQGLKQFESVEPDLVITDIVMPDMEGIEFIKALVKKKKDIPVIVMSGNIVGRKFLKTACLFGAKAALTKPFTTQELIETIDRILAE
jgi:DNA-binding response OmpR family regulator